RLVIPERRSLIRDRNELKRLLFCDLPCLRSSGVSVFPRLVISEHCAQDDDKFSHDGGDGDLEGLSPAGQPLGKIAEDGVRPDGGESSHIEACADLAAPGEDPSFSALLAAVAISGKKAKIVCEATAPMPASVCMRRLL